MAKIGTAQIEIKPVLNEEALEAIASRIEDAVARGVQRGLRAKTEAGTISIRVEGQDFPATLYTRD